MQTQAVADVGGAVPPVAVGSFVLLGFPLQEWVLALTAVYTVILIIKNISAAGAVVSRGVQKVWQKVRQQKKP